MKPKIPPKRVLSKAASKSSATKSSASKSSATKRTATNSSASKSSASKPAVPERSPTRRTTDARTRGRAADVVERVLTATAELLGERGYAALRIEDVAVRSDVNKTTIYRRWPTRPELVSAAVQRLKPPVALLRGGSLRDEVLAHARAIAAFHTSKLGRGIVRVIQLEQSHPELEPLVRDARQQATRDRIAIVERAITRRELPAGTDPRIIADLLFLPFLTRLMRHDEPLDETYVSAVLDIVVTGARAKRS